MKHQVSQTETVVFSICQGWVDILTVGHISANTKYDKNANVLDDKTIYASLDVAELKLMLFHAADYLNRYLNQGSFEGPSGARIDVIMRL